MAEYSLGFVHCPHCGEAISSNGRVFPTKREEVEWALERCECRGAKEWREQGMPPLLEESPCEKGKLLKSGGCGYVDIHVLMPKECTREQCIAWHPELYVDNLYRDGWRKYQARKRQAAEWEQFRPDSLLMAYILHLPDPAEYWTAPRFTTGTCRCCGQQHILTEPCSTQEEADGRATDGCKCTGGQKYHRQLQEREIIEAMFAEMEEETIEFLQTVAGLLRDGYIASGTSVKLGGSVTAKFKEKDGVVVITRSEKVEHQHSI